MVFRDGWGLVTALVTWLCEGEFWISALASIYPYITMTMVSKVNLALLTNMYKMHRIVFSN